MTNTWNTPSGAKIELTSKHITTETINADGHMVEVPADEIRISVKINGKDTAARLTQYQGQNVLYVGSKVINGKTHPLYAAIPADVYEAVWGEYDRRRIAKADAAIEADKKYQANYNKVIKAMEG